MRLSSYNNGGYLVDIFDDGTKIRTKVSEDKPVYPESMDVKITNFCVGPSCQFCHEGSNIDGEHSQLLDYLNIFQQLPKGAEIAIGGGNPLSHPQLDEFLQSLKNFGLIPNITVNQYHLDKNSIKRLQDWQENGMIYGVGISYLNKADKLPLNNVVYHVIAGVHKYEVLRDLAEENVLVLGYKQLRRGATYYSRSVENKKLEWYRHIRDYLGSQRLSFDNLAIEQLRLYRFLSAEKWAELYMGNDGEFTMYLDLVNGEYAKSSTSNVRHKITCSIKDMFGVIKNEK